MRRTALSNGFLLGRVDGASIDVLPLADDSEPVTLAQVEAFCCHVKTEWFPAGDNLVSLAKRKMHGVVGYHQATKLSVRFLWSPKQTPVQALQEIARLEGANLAPPLAAACLVAATYPQSAYGIPWLFANLSGLQGAGYERIPTLNHEQLGALAERHATTSNFSLADSPVLNAVDSGRFWLQVARTLWEAALMARLARAGTRAGFNVSIASTLAGAYLALTLPLKISARGVALGCQPDSYPTIWPQVLEWYAGEISPATLQNLTNGQAPNGARTLNHFTEEASPGAAVNAALAAGLTTALVREAETAGVYAPVGTFTLELPADYPLRAWGITALKLNLSPTGLWCAVINTDGKFSVIFEWRPGQPLRHLVIELAAQPLVAVTLAALWRDLRVAGEEAVPLCHAKNPAAPRPIGEAPGVSKPAQVSQPPGSRHNARILPAIRLTLAGSHEWGSAQERAHVERQTHSVRGHMRELRAGWQRRPLAAQEAGAFGLVLPDGYTFVTPHLRGEGALAAAPRLKARGLATVSLLLR